MEKAYYRKTRGKSLRIPPDAGNDGTKASETVPAEKLIGRRRRRKILKRCAMIAAAFVLLFAVLNRIFAGPAAAAAERETKRLAAELINASVLETMEEYELEGGTASFTSQHVNAEGTGFLYIDSAKLNLMSSRIVEKINGRIGELQSTGVALPVGTVSGIAVLNGLGPELTARVVPIGSVERNFSASFTAAGVNQTRYSAMLELRIELLVLFGGTQRTVTVECSAPLVETVVIGAVPHAYTDVSTLEDALNLIPTDAE